MGAFPHDAPAAIHYKICTASNRSADDKGQIEPLQKLTGTLAFMFAP